MSKPKNIFIILLTLIKKYRIIILAMIGMVLFLVLFFGAYIQKNLDKNTVIYMNNFTEDHISEILPSMKVEQQFLLPTSSFTGFQIQLATFRRSNSGVLVVDLYRDNDFVQKWKIDQTTVKDGEYYTFVLNEKIKNAKTEEFSILISAEGTSAGNGVTVFTSGFDYFKKGSLFINGDEVEGDISFNISTDDNTFLVYLYIFIAIVLLFVVISSMYMFLYKALKLHKAFLIVSIPLCIVFSLIVTPYGAPDEDFHVSSVYSHASAVVFGATDGQSRQVPMRACDANIQKFSYYPNINTIRAVQQDFYKGCDDNSIRYIDSRLNESKFSTLFYLPQIIGVSLGMVLGTGQILTLMLGKWFSLAFHIIISFFCIKKSSSFKRVIFLFALLPMVLHQAASYSYDATLILTTMLFFTLGSEILAYNNYSKLDIVLFVGASILLSFMKVIYFPLLLLVILIYFKNRKMRKICIFSIATSASLWLLSSLSSVAPLVQENSNGRYTIHDAMGQPVESILVFFRTIFENLGKYIIDAIGSSFAWSNIPIPVWIPIFLLLLFVFFSFRTCDEKVLYNRKQIIIITIAVFTVILLAIISMSFGWAPRGATIVGVQGRYFFPVIPFIGVALYHIPLQLKLSVTNEKYSLLMVFLVTSIVCCAALHAFQYIVNR